VSADALKPLETAAELQAFLETTSSVIKETGLAPNQKKWRASIATRTRDGWKAVRGEGEDLGKALADAIAKVLALHAHDEEKRRAG
jgi:hypothetical protein